MFTKFHNLVQLLIMQLYAKYNVRPSHQLILHIHHIVHYTSVLRFTRLRSRRPSAVDHRPTASTIFAEVTDIKQQ